MKARPVSDRFSMDLAAFFGSTFWIGLIAAGLWTGTSYAFLNVTQFLAIFASLSWVESRFILMLCLV
ncbi:hypothetical protein [Fischerella muscicola]|uniref:hypothetical protein n=1 Tax=Fischerella muscicola TaxID=92938 RepID=UPI00138B1179|nr:hypothetical protein [Fischerella muscicola]